MHESRSLRALNGILRGHDAGAYQSRGPGRSLVAPRATSGRSESAARDHPGSLDRDIPSMSVDEPYDPLRDYGAGLPADLRCDPAKAYWRRGPGHAPDCSQQAGLDIAPRRSCIRPAMRFGAHRTRSSGLFCCLARSPMECGCRQRQLGCAATRKRGRRRMPRGPRLTRCDAWQLVCERRHGNAMGRRSHARDRVGSIATRRSLHLLCRELPELPARSPCDS